jgi:nicotinamidase-related amidase
MRTIDHKTSALLVVDFQARLMPAIEGGAATIANARRLLDAAALLDVPALFTEQNPRGLGATMPELAQARDDRTVLHKMTFDACRARDTLGWLPERPELIVIGCEAHVCVLQTVLGLLEAGRKVFVVQDAIGSRRAESKDVALQRMARHGAEIVTTEMVIFEWLVSAEHPRFRQVMALVK